MNVFAYCAWSPIDLVSSGASEIRKRYGLIYNDQDDFGNGMHARYPKDSYHWYKRVIETNGRELYVARVGAWALLGTLVSKVDKRRAFAWRRG